MVSSASASAMAPPARKNHNSIVKVLVPCATIYGMESYRKWMSSKTTMKEIGKGQQLELSDLPDDLMESLLERLSSADRIRFGATCKKNLSFFVTTAQQQQHHYQYQFRTIDKLPWMASFIPGFVEMLFRLYEPRHQSGQPNYVDYLIRDTEGGEGLGYLRRTKIKACKKGWFLCLLPKEEEGMTSFLLFCPFNKRIIKLPDLDHDVGGKYIWLDQWSCHATFSSDDPSSTECVFFFWSSYSTPGKHKISTLDQKSGKWNTKLFDILIDNVESVVYHEGCFYCLSLECQLAAYDVVHQTLNLIAAPFFPLNATYDVSGLVACEGKLLIASVELASHKYNNLEVFRCSLFEFNSSTSSWVERTTLGDHALFLGDPTPFTVPVPSLSSVADRMYFYSSRIDKDCSIYYSFRDGRCHMSENGDYWSVKREMWIEPLPTS